MTIMSASDPHPPHMHPAIPPYMHPAIPPYMHPAISYTVTPSLSISSTQFHGMVQVGGCLDMVQVCQQNGSGGDAWAWCRFASTECR